MKGGTDGRIRARHDRRRVLHASESTAAAGTEAQGDGVVVALLHTIRRELAQAAEATDTEWMPRVTRYPY